MGPGGVKNMRLEPGCKNPPTLRVSVLDPSEVYLPPYPPSAVAPRRRFAKTTVFLEDFAQKRFKRLRRGVPGGSPGCPRGGVLEGVLGSITASWACLGSLWAPSPLGASFFGLPLGAPLVYNV